jgi:hypothetical protein
VVRYVQAGRLASALSPIVHSASGSGTPTHRCPVRLAAARDEPLLVLPCGFMNLMPVAVGRPVGAGVDEIGLVDHRGTPRPLLGRLEQPQAGIVNLFIPISPGGH